MKECKYKNVDTIIKHYGNDWSNLILDGVDFNEMDLSEIKLPYDEDLFEKIKYSSLLRTQLPKGDYSKYSFGNVYLCECKFTPDSKFSSDKDVFQKIYDRDLTGAALPYGDYSEYNFDMIWIRECQFTPDSVFSNNKDVFQQIYGRDLCGVSLPEGDYSQYDFKDVSLTRTEFTEDSILPEYENFLSELKSAEDCNLPKNVIINIHNYNLENVSLNLDTERGRKLLRREQLDIIKAKYSDRVGSRIILPDTVYGKNNDDMKNYKF